MRGAGPEGDRRQATAGSQTLPPLDILPHESLVCLIIQIQTLYAYIDLSISISQAAHIESLLPGANIRHTVLAQHCFDRHSPISSAPRGNQSQHTSLVDQMSAWRIWLYRAQTCTHEHRMRHISFHNET